LPIAELEKLINQGLFNEALDFISKIDIIDNKLKLLKVEIYRELGEYQQAIDLVQTILQDNNIDDNIRAGSFVELAYLNYRLENFEEVSNLLRKSDQIIDKMDQNNKIPLKFKFHCVQGNNFWKLSQLEFALKSYKESLKLADEVDNGIFQAQALNSIGNIKLQMGKYSDAISFYMKCITI
jgi:tetratricopeptide (TPR) repeat protein